MVFQNPQCTDEALEQIYDDRDADELIRLYERIATESFLAEYNKKLAELETAVPGKGRLLDFACAAGYLMELAQGRGWDAHGVDIGSWCQKAAAKRGLRNLHIGQLRELAFPDHHFDVVYAAQVLEHLPDPKADLTEIRRILRPGGTLYVDVPNYRCLSILLGRDRFELNNPPQHINYFTPQTLSRLIQDANFRVERVSSDGGVKWENIFGCKLRSEIWEAYQTPDPASKSSHPPPTARRQSIFRRMVYPSFKLVFYEWGKVGMNLTLLATRTSD
jgi:2-polyprenyl-3-methyl-5-hydroxy-6-metoxy-1,4-benzoquinol methylase